MDVMAEIEKTSRGEKIDLLVAWVVRVMPLKTRWGKSAEIPAIIVGGLFRDKGGQLFFSFFFRV